jgi:ATP-dependent helicase/nuclease subunit B
MAGKADGGTLPLFGRPRIFSVPPSASFLDTLADAILRGDLTGGVAPGPLDLADTLVYLPNHTACRGLQAAFLDAAKGGATLLPRIRPIGGAEEDALLILHAAETEEPNSGGPVAPAIGALERRMVLTQLILAWADRVKRGAAGEIGALALSIAETPAAASEMALGLMRLMDEADTEGVDLGRLRELSPERFAVHEQLSLDFLEIVLTAWPAYLEASGRLNPMARRNRVMALEIDALREAKTDKPVIVAGSLGTIPATAALIEAAYMHPRGVAVLPGVDLWLDHAGWEKLGAHAEHPQAAVGRLLARLGATRADVVPLPAKASVAEAARARFVSEAMRPSSTVAAWPGYVESTHPSTIRAGLADVSLVTAPTPQDEAGLIATILREAAEDRTRTASLITPDRTLARRVRAQLGRWGLNLPDDAGTPLAATPAGVFHQLIADAATTGSRIELLALLKHPLTRLGLPRGAVEVAAPVIEMAAIRQPWGGDGVDHLARSLALTRQHHFKHAALDRLADADWDAAEAAIASFVETLQPLTKLARRKGLSLQALAEAHRTAARRLSSDENAEPPAPDIAGEAMAVFMAALAGETPGPALALKDYPELFRSLLRLETCADAEAGHPRLRILGPREARLTAADTVIIAGMNEGSWPAAPDNGPWLNRAMRDALGLPPAERQTALSAHDFAQAMGASEVILTRAFKADGTPTVPSRWLLRMEALLGGFGLGDALVPKRPWLEWWTSTPISLDVQRTKAPSPRPPVEARPRQLSISDIARLMANPYAIYARHILGLRPLEALEAEPGGAERGRIIHETLHRFARQFPRELPETVANELLGIFDSYTAPFGDNARIAAFWRPRMERFARWFAETEAERRQGVREIFAQVSGELSITTPAGPFTLRGSADRIDALEDGSLAIYDYKGGNLPSEADVAAFRSPQLPLEALIALQGRFRGVESHSVAKLAYLSAKGGEPAGEEKLAARESAEVLAKAAGDGLAKLLARFDDAETPYTAMRRGAFSSRYDDYAHLARVEEWSGVSEEG